MIHDFDEKGGPLRRRRNGGRPAKTGEFAAFRCFALNGTDRRSPVVQDTAIGGNIRWHNQHARPTRNFAVGAKIRR
ncbi:hypothetical protein [Nocardia sp. NPDC058114]|uniref:hypothetical protein n=1 Tax=Nocardia sp. NPDC058114 TaxID=3346346 RepID=UPI0036D93B27